MREFVKSVLYFLAFAAALSGQVRLEISPVSGYMFFTGDTIKFSCVAYNQNDSIIALKSVLWEVNGGMIGSQDAFEKWDMPAGKFSIVIDAKTMDGAAVSDSINLIIIPFDAVEVCCAGGWASRAVYWKDGGMYEIPDAVRQLKSASFYNGDLYFLEDNNADTAHYWKNGIKFDLPSKKIGFIGSVYVANTDVFFVGADADSVNARATACYWQNGEKHYVSLFQSYACDITTMGKDLYVLGGEYSDSISIFRMLPCYWKNGVKTSLPVLIDTQYHIVSWEAKWGGVHNNNVWIAGIDNFHIEDNLIPVGWVCNNGNKTYLDDGSGISSLVNPEHGIAISSFSAGQKGVYAVGFVSATYKSFLWANGTPKEWHGPEGQTAAPKAVYVLYNHVFVAGTYVKNNRWVLCYWRNEKCYDVMELDSSGPNSALRIFAIAAEVKPESTWVKFNKGKNKGIFSAQINPILSAMIQKEKLILEFALRKNSKIDIEMLDVSGRIVFKKSFGVIEAGKQQIKISLPQAGMRVYTVRLRSDGQSWTRKVGYVK